MNDRLRTAPRTVAAALAAPLLAACVWLVAGWPQAARATDAGAIASASVGEVTLAIGQARLERAADAAASIATPAAVLEPQKGVAVRQGDTIRTSANGHVHIRFVDGALVSIRPNSVFRIHEFQYDPANPATSTVRLSLDSGEARSISGAAAKAARERFRLNTPLVAIGVKGTDFLTQTGPLATRVTVNEGAIVMAPFDQGCRAEGLGVCAGARARELRADMGGLALIYRSGAADPSFQPARGEGNGGSDSVKLQLLERQQRENKDATSQSVQVANDTRAPLDVLPASRLLWGRWANTALPGDNLTIPFLEALRGNDITVGDGYFFLFRQPGVPNLLPNLNSKVDFALQSSAAYYRQPSNDISAATVRSGTLGIDFANRSYNTTLNLSAEAVGNQSVSFGGSLNPQTGIFLGNNASGGSLAGALTLDGSRAGYQFRAPAVGGGSFSGATLWGRTP